MRDPGDLTFTEHDDPLVRDLLAKEQIREVIRRYCRGVDRRDWALVRSCYHDDALDHHGSYSGPVDGFVAWVSAFLPQRYEATTHVMGNCTVDVHGDEAFAETYVVATHRGLPGGATERSDMTAAGRLHDRFALRDGRWRIAYREVVYDWSRVDPVGAPYPMPDAALVGGHGSADPTVGRDPSPDRVH